MQLYLGLYNYSEGKVFQGNDVFLAFLLLSLMLYQVSTFSSYSLCIAIVIGVIAVLGLKYDL